MIQCEIDLGDDVMRGKSEQIHVVEAGDTLYSLGKKYNVTAAAIL